jgi:hypothetical protein
MNISLQSECILNPKIRPEQIKNDIKSFEMSLLQYVRWKEYKLCSMHALACVYRKFCKVLRFFNIFYLLPKFHLSSGAGNSFNILSVYSIEGEWKHAWEGNPKMSWTGNLPN